MSDPIAESLLHLATGLRPYIASRTDPILRTDIRKELDSWDAQQQLLFMWERWNDLFRSDLSFVERSVISELREFRNRWAHQQSLSLADEYRFLDSAERLLHAVNSPEQTHVRDLRKSTLDRLWKEEVQRETAPSRLQKVWPWLLCGVSCAALSTAILLVVSVPWSWGLCLLIFVGTMRVAWLQSEREEYQGFGPRECRTCHRIIYSVDCPYCLRADRPLHSISTGSPADAEQHATSRARARRASNPLVTRSASRLSTQLPKSPPVTATAPASMPASGDRVEAG
jgi:hypothetical protein